MNVGFRCSSSLILRRGSSLFILISQWLEGPFLIESLLCVFYRQRKICLIFFDFLNRSSFVLVYQLLQNQIFFSSQDRTPLPAVLRHPSFQSSARNIGYHPL